MTWHTEWNFILNYTQIFMESFICFWWEFTFQLILQSVFDFSLIRSLISRSDFRYTSILLHNCNSFLLAPVLICIISCCTVLKCFRFTFDAMHAVTGAYAKPIFVEKLGASPVCLFTFLTIKIREQCNGSVSNYLSIYRIPFWMGCL